MGIAQPRTVRIGARRSFIIGIGIAPARETNHFVSRSFRLLKQPFGHALRDTGPVLRIGIISDTHGLLRPEAERQLAGVAHVIHAGDIGRPDVLVGLRRIAPVTAIRGNIDTADWAQRYPDTQVVRLAGRSFYVLHDIQELQIDPASSGIDVVVSGHSHRPRIETSGGVLYLNPGSAGPRRFNLPVTLTILEVTASGLRP